MSTNIELLLEVNLVVMLALAVFAVFEMRLIHRLINSRMTEIVAGLRRESDMSAAIAHAAGVEEGRERGRTQERE